MEHKGYLLDHDGFHRDLEPIIVSALASGNPGELREFIEKNLIHLRDPYEGEALGDDWESMIETTDAHQYGDFALTKFYDLQRDIGLGHNWSKIQEYLLPIHGSLVLGAPIGHKGNWFDPGKMGSYFQSVSLVRENYGKLKDLIDKNCDLEGPLSKAMKILRAAKETEKGLYVTF